MEAVKKKTRNKKPKTQAEFVSRAVIYENTCGEKGAKIVAAIGAVEDHATVPHRSLAENVIVLEVRSADGGVVARFSDFDLKIVGELALDLWNRTRGAG